MKKRILLVLAAMVLCAAGLAAASPGEPDPGPVAELLCQRLSTLNKRPGVLEKKATFVPLEGQRYVLPFSGGELELYAYRDQDGAARDLMRVSEDGRQVGEHYVVWSREPHFFLRDNVIVLYVGDDGAVFDMLERLCGPQIRGAAAQL